MMRILPDNPNLDFLRREAKQLLAAMREQDAGVLLNQAQQVLADQYGFRTWPDLKKEVERRRSSPPNGDADLARALAEVFDLGELTAPMTAVSYAFMGRRWRLETDRGVWQAGPVFDWIDNEQAEVGATLRDRAREAGVIAPRPVRAADGELVKTIGDQRWRIDAWMDLGPEVLQPVRSSIAHQVGRNLATVHRVGTPTDHVLTPGASGHLTHRHSDAQWAQLIERTRAAEAPWLDDLVRLRTEVLSELEAVPAPEIDQPFRICINDLNIGAVRMGAGDDLILVHWDFAGPNQPAWELGYVLVQWAAGTVANPGTARALVDGYRESAELPRLEPSSFWLSITANLNWTYDRFCTALDGSDAERQAFSRNELQDLVTDPLSVATIDRLLAEVA